jgi:5-hydroxyisourate hydrolase-like protein (transthyretin family)
VAGAQVTVTGAGPTLTAVTDADGQYFVEGASGAVTVTVRALDPLTQLLGYGTGQMNRVNGFVNINVVLIAAGAFQGQVVDPTGAPAGANVQIRLFEAGSLATPVSTTFTDAAGRWLFPLVAIGNYVIDATDAQGNHGVSSASITASGQEVTVPVTYLGRGSVHGTVRNAAGAGVANASVTLNAQSLFGSAPAVTRNAESDGSFRFDGVFIGTFTVSAIDPISGLSGGAAGSITGHAQDVEANIGLAPTANLQGRVFRSDGTTPVAGGVTVLVQYCFFDPRCTFSTTTDSEGRYAFTFLPLGSFTLSASEPSTRGRGSVQGTLSVNGETRTLNVNLLPQGSLVVTVRNADDLPIAGANVIVVEGSGSSGETLGGTTDQSGQAVIGRVLAGSFTVTAVAGGLTGQVTGVLAPNAVLPVAVRLEATATIRGTLFAPDGQTPATGGRISLFGVVPPYPSYIADVGADGSYNAAGIRLNTYELRATDESGRLRAILPGVAVSANGQVETRDLTEVGLATVRGRVINPDSSSASGINVSIQSLNPTFGGFRSATTDAAGFYEATGLAVGDVFVRAGDQSRNLLGEARGTLAQHDEVLVLDILLQNNAVSPSSNRYDGNGSLFQTQQDGSVLNSVASVFTGSGSSQGGFKLQLTPVGGTATSFTGASIATVEDGGQELAIRQPVVGATGLDVTRKIFIPQDGYFARYLEILTNPTASDITVDVRVQSHLRSFSGTSQPRASSDGNTQLNLGADHWVTLDDNTDGDPIWVSTGTPVGFVFDAPGAAAPVTVLTYPNNVTLTYQWRVTVPANGQAALMHFGVQQTSRAAAAASAARLVQLPPEALAGLSPSELLAIRNFVVPADGLSALAPAPRVDGRITGRVLEADGTTVVPNAPVRFVSNNLLFARQINLSANASGVFTVTASLANRQPVAIDGFTLVATYPSPSVLSPAATGSFGAGATTATQDIVFSNLGRVAGVLRRHDGTAVTGATVQLSGPGYNQQKFVASDGSFTFGGLGAGTFTFAAEKSHPQGTGVRNQPAAITLAAGQTANVVVLLQPTGVLQGTLRTGAGAAVANRSVEMFVSGLYRSTVTDTSGRYTSTEMPVGTYTLRSYDYVANIYATRQFEITQDQTTTADLSFLGLATVSVTVTRTNGTPAANVNVNLQSFNNPQFSVNRNGVSDATGRVSFTNVPVGPYRVVAYPGVNSSTLLATSDPFTVDADNTVVPVTVTMAPYGSSRIRLTYGNGAVAVDRLVDVYSPTFSWSNYTDYLTGETVFDGIPLDTPFTARAQRWEDYSVSRTVTGLTVTSDGQELITDLRLPALARVRVTVLRADGQPFSNARIYTQDSVRPYLQNRGITDSLGQMTLYNVPEGPFTAAVYDANTGIELQSATIQVVPADENTQIEMPVTVTAVSGTVEGTVYAADGTSVLTGAYVYAYDTRTGAFMSYTFVDANGLYRFANLLPGQGGFRVRAYTPNGAVYGERTGSFSVSGETQTLDIIVPVVSVVVSGHVFVSDGATPLPDAQIDLYSSDGTNYNYIASASVDALGAFTLPSSFVATGEGQLRVYIPQNNTRHERLFTVPPQGGAIAVDVIVPLRIGTVRGIVTAGDGITRLPNARVLAFYDIVVPPNCECDSRIELGQMTTDSEGRFEFANILARDSGFMLGANSPNYTAYVQQDVVFPGQHAVVDNIVLAVPVAMLTGTVTFQNGDPVPNPTVFATVTATGATWFAQTNGQGRYSIEGLPDGPFTLTAQDPGSGLTVSVSGTFVASSVQRLDAVLPPSTAVLVRALAGNGTPLPSVTVVLVAGSFQRQIVTGATGEALFAQVGEGPTYVQARWHDGTGYQFASGNLDVVAGGGTMTVTLQFGAGGTVSGQARDSGGAPILSPMSIRVVSFGSIGPLGSFDRTVNADANGVYSIPNVPVGLVQVILAPAYGIANGSVTAGATTTIDVTVGNARALPAILSGADTFRYDVQSEGYLNDGGTNGGRLSDAYDGMYRQSVNNLQFPSISVAEMEVTDREIALGPRPNGQLLVTRKVFVPAAGGFARYLEIVTNLSARASDVTVAISGNLGSDSSTLLQVSPVATNNTYAVTFENYSSSSDPSLAHVFAGAGAVAVTATASFTGDNASYSWSTSVPAGGTAIFMHFAVQREPGDYTSAQTQALALVNLTDPNALAFLSPAERAAIRNFVVP